jgi:RNA polymerase sigma-70 factor (ECF subfamily)
VAATGFASAVRTRHRYRADGSPLAGIWQMVVNASISERRRRTRHAADAGSVQPPVAADGNTDELAVRLAAALALVSERQRLVVFLHYYADMDYATISDVLGISPGTVAATLHGARQTMHAALTAEEVQR